MSALAGGDADKLGNRYEDWWTLLRLADLLSGTAAVMRLEPPGPAGDGVEFWVDEPDLRWLEQAKDHASGGNWTVHRLIERKVLGSIQHHLSLDQRVRLVFSTAAPGLSALTSRARKATSSLEFRDETLSNELRADLSKVAKLWATDLDATWSMLTRLEIEHHPPETLRRLLLLRYEGLVHGDPQDVIYWLRGWLTDHLQQPLTGTLVWAALSTARFRRALTLGDPDLLAALERSVERHRTRTRASLPAIRVAQPAHEQLADLLRDDRGPRIALVHGRAGSGKSVVAGHVVDQLRLDGWYAAAITMDGGSTTRTASALGVANDLPGSPIAALAQVSQGGPAVLFVDQLDAVSTYSGRMPDSFEAVSELLDEASMFPWVRLVLAVRTVDLKEDPRLRELQRDSRATALAIPDLERDAVLQALVESGHDAARLSVQTLDLLCVPLHLSVFSRLSREAQDTSYTSLTALYERYARELRRRLELQLGQLDWAGITSALVSAMSDAESLRVPEAVLDSASITQVNALVSSGIIEREGQQLRFFHETFFDFLFARAFVSGRRNLHDFLVSSGQQLFRRGQTRQVLEYLAGTDPEVFRGTVVELLSSATLRPHLREVVATVLFQHRPDPSDWLAVEPLAFGPNPAVRGRLIPLLGAGAWFDAVDAAGLWPVYLTDDQKLPLVADQIITAARSRGVRVSALVSPYIGTSDVWRNIMRAIVQWSLNPETVELAITLMQRGELDGVKGPIAVNSDFFSIVYGLHKEDPASAARLVGAHLRRGIARSAAEGSNDPFQDDYLGRQGSDREILQTIAETAPLDYVEHIGRPLIQIIEATAVTRVIGQLRRTKHWAFRHPDDDSSFPDMLFTGLEIALRTLASQSPKLTQDLVATWSLSDIEELRFLACRTYLALGDCDLAIAFLTSDEHNLQLGYSDSPRWASRELIEMASAGCTDAELAALTQQLLWCAPPWERTAQSLRWRGRSEYDLMSAISAVRRDGLVTRRLGELERKFPTSPALPPSTSTMASFKGSPIREAGSSKLTDRQWRRAIARYDQDDRRHSWDHGGSHELAAQLGRRAAEDPERFLRFALSLGAGTPGIYLVRIIDSIAGLISTSELSALCSHSHEVAGRDVLRSVTDAIEKASDLDEPLARLLAIAAADQDPESDRDWKDLVTAGLNCTRGGAARAIAVLWFAGYDHVSRLLPTIATLVSDPVLSVRAMTAEAVAALLRHDPDEALNLAERLLDTSEVLVGASTASRLLRYCVMHDTTRFSVPLARALASSDESAREAGAIWAMALVQERLTSQLPSNLATMSDSARRGAAEALASAPTLALDTYVALLDDDDGDVREAAARGMRRLAELGEPESETLLSAAISTRGFAEHADHAFHALSDSERRLPASALVACERAVDALGPQLGDIRTGISIAARDITTIVLRLYRQGEEEVRVRCLNLIDALTEVRAYGLDDQIDAIR